MENKSISELEGWKWKGEIPSRETHGGVETRFYELHNIPLSKLGMDDLRFLIGQESCLTYLVPKALSILKEDVFIESEYYKGDLLVALFQISKSSKYWDNHLDEKNKLIELYQNHKKQLSSLDIPHDVLIKIKATYNEFLL